MDPSSTSALLESVRKRIRAESDEFELVDVFCPEELDGVTRARVARVDAELDRIARQIEELERAKAKLCQERCTLFRQQRYVMQEESAGMRVDYTCTTFPWSANLLLQGQRVFQIKRFYDRQEAACNAAMAGRDMLVVMPPGAGKSLCYQLPALLLQALTVVISPSIALVYDQVYHLRMKQIPCALLTHKTGKADMDDTLKSLRHKDLFCRPKLLYVSPEFMANSTVFLPTLRRVYAEGRLARFVVDEAHCCSIFGHDYRPEYYQLSLCRRLFPATPVMALTATLGPRTLRDILVTLGLRAATAPAAALPHRTVYFRQPLHRHNLVYRVVARPSNWIVLHQVVSAYIMQHYPDQSGIVYCLSQKDTQAVAHALQFYTYGRIRTGVIHAALTEQEKLRVHAEWRTGRIQVVCATAPFGMGIDKSNVRFVIHTCLAPTLEAYFLETGRAG